MKVIGVSAGFHDASACLYLDGELVFASAEERWSRVSHDGSAPIRAIEQALSWAGVNASEIDHLAIGWSDVCKTTRSYWQLKAHAFFDGLLSRHDKSLPRILASDVMESLRVIQTEVGIKPVRKYLSNVPITYVDHHKAHAMSAAIPSGFDEASVLVIDGRGAFEATSLWHYRHKKLELVEMIPWPNSLGNFYAKFTAYLGFKPLSDEWKVMGLAAWGHDGVDLGDFITIDEDSYQVNARALNYNSLFDVSAIEQKFGPKGEEGASPTQQQKDIAFAVQRDCERAMLAMVRRLLSKTKCQNLCMAGGVHLNCKANGRIVSEVPLKQVFIQPAAGDDGAAIGAALAVINEKQPELVIAPQKNSYFGSQISDESIEEHFRRYKLPVKKMQDPPKMIASLLSEGNIIGLFQGRMEFGPRALGCRSIIADPRDPDMTRKVNEGVKFRETWRPFAPAILEERYGDYFTLPFLSPYMILSGPVRQDKQHLIPAVVHIDGTARPQSVNEATNPYYWSIIKEFEILTGVPVILNTSFNLKGEPIVASPYDAIRTFMTSGLDVLVLEDYILRKSEIVT